MSKSVAPRGIDYPQNYDCQGEGGGHNFPSHRYLDGFDMISCVLLGSCATLSVFLAATTVYYRRKARILQQGEKGEIQEQERTRGTCGDRKEKKKELSWKYPQQAVYTDRDRGRDKRRRRSSSRHQEPAPIHSYLDLDLVEHGGGMYHEQYDEHGVLIPRPDI